MIIMFKKKFLYLHGRKKNFTSLASQGQLASARCERACERVSELARSLAKNLKSSSSRSLARLKIEVAQLALARSRKFSPIFCTLVVATCEDHTFAMLYFILPKERLTAPGAF